MFQFNAAIEFPGNKEQPGRYQAIGIINYSWEMGPHEEHPQVMFIDGKGNIDYAPLSSCKVVEPFGIFGVAYGLKSVPPVVNNQAGENGSKEVNIVRLS